jgi:Cys-tRNA(Pro)/Cys-tRNA(Cys) deacylase
MMTTNNITRLLDNRKINYKVFELPRQKLGAEQTARLLNAPLSIIFKSIVIERKNPGKPILAVVPGDKEVNLKALAKVVGEKKVTPATQKNAERLTKLQAGGISPLALINRGFKIVIDDSVLTQETIHISGGELGVNIRLRSQDLVDLTQASLAKISRD